MNNTNESKTLTKNKVMPCEWYKWKETILERGDDVWMIQIN